MVEEDVRPLPQAFPCHSKPNACSAASDTDRFPLQEHCHFPHHSMATTINENPVLQKSDPLAEAITCSAEATALITPGNYEVTVSAEGVCLWNKALQTGYWISYSEVVLFAIENENGIYMQLMNAEEEEEAIELRLGIDGAARALYYALVGGSALHASTTTPRQESPDHQWFTAAALQNGDGAFEDGHERSDLVEHDQDNIGNKYGRIE